MTFRVKFHHENSGNCTTTFKDINSKRYFNRIHSNNVDAGKWCTVHPSGGYWESDTPVLPDVIFVVVDEDGNTLFTESNANLGAFQSVGDRARQFAKEWAERLCLKTYEEWKRWLSDDERAARYGEIDNWLYAEAGTRGTEAIGSYEHLGMSFGIMDEKMDHIICGKEWRYIYILDMENNNTEAICGYIFEEETAAHETGGKYIGDRYRRVCENLGWTISEVDENRIELGKYSPAGEDFSFTIDIENFVEGMKEYTNGFNIDEHIEMWIEARKNGVRGVPSTRELVKDAEDIDEMLRELVETLAEEDNHD